MMNTELYRIPEPIKDSYSKTGENNKGLIICASGSDLTESSKVFLTKILAAIGYDLDKDCLVLALLPENEIAFSQLFRNEEVSDLFIFGLNPAVLGLNIQVSPYTTIKMEHMRLLWSHALTELQADKAKKVKLWQTLQQSFLKD